MLARVSRSALRIAPPSKQFQRLNSTMPAASAKPLYAAQAEIPHLPVPTLSSTFHKYVESIEPHITPEALKTNKEHVKQFLESPLSSTLQKRLEERAAEKECWLTEWWNETAYMGYRDSIVPNVNYYYVHTQGLGKGASQTRRAAEIVLGVRNFRELLVSERLEPEKIKGKPLDSSSYPNLFNTSRIPTKPSDTFKYYDPAENEHVIAIRKDRYFKVPTKGLTASELDQAFQKVIEVADARGQGPAVGALTGDNRDTWTDARDHLISLSPENAKSLEAIESSILVICLDDASPVAGRDGRSWNIYTGDGRPARNRWFDKHSFVVDPKGESGYNGEHSMMDGTPTVRMNEFVLGALEAGKIPLDSIPQGEPKGQLKVEEIIFEVDDKMNKYITGAQEALGSVLRAQDLKVVQFDHYGKDVIKKHKVSPDAWVQMIKQLAYGKMNGGKPAVTYESAQTRKFLGGRTEVIRASSNQSKAFVQAMLDPSKSDVEREKLFRDAAGRHIQYAAWAADGQGVDRHMFGLKKLLKEGEPLPELYKDEAFGLTSTWTFSTSNLTCPFFDNWGYGQVTADGWGLSYSIGEHFLRWGIMTNNGKADELKKNLIWAADELRRMMDSAAKQKSGDSKAKL